MNDLRAALLKGRSIGYSVTRLINRKGEKMEQYECVCTDSRFLYMAEDLAEAMAYHNRQSPEHREKVLHWIGPTGIRFQFHDSKMGI